VIIDRNARSSQIAQYSAMQQSDVKIFETIGRRSLTTASALIKIDAVLDVLAKRPGTLEAKVFDEHGGILASGDPGVIGTIDTDPRIANVIRTGDAYAGHEGDPNLDPRDFEFIAPVELPTGRYAYEVTYDHARSTPSSRPCGGRSCSSAGAAWWPESHSSTSSAAATSSVDTGRPSPGRLATG
jgi:hypothetical protein